MVHFPVIFPIIIKFAPLLDAEKIAINIGIHKFQQKFLLRNHPMPPSNYFTPRAAIEYLPPKCAVMTGSQRDYPCQFIKTVPRHLNPMYVAPTDSPLVRESYSAQRPARGKPSGSRVVHVATMMAVKDAVMRNPARHPTLAKSVPSWCQTAAAPYEGTVIPHKHVPRTRPGIVRSHVQALRRTSNQVSTDGSILHRPRAQYPTGLTPMPDTGSASQTPKNEWEFSTGPLTYTWNQPALGCSFTAPPIPPCHAEAGELLLAQLTREPSGVPSVSQPHPPPNIVVPRPQKTARRKVTAAVSAFQSRLSDFFTRSSRSKQAPSSSPANAASTNTTTDPAHETSVINLSSDADPDISLPVSGQQGATADLLESLPRERSTTHRPPATPIASRRRIKYEIYSIEPPTPLGTPSSIQSTHYPEPPGGPIPTTRPAMRKFRTSRGIVKVEVDFSQLEQFPSPSGGDLAARYEYTELVGEARDRRNALRESLSQSRAPPDTVSDVTDLHLPYRGRSRRPLGSDTASSLGPDGSPIQSRYGLPALQVATWFEETERPNPSLADGDNYSCVELELDQDLREVSFPPPIQLSGSGCDAHVASTSSSHSSSRPPPLGLSREDYAEDSLAHSLLAASRPVSPRSE